MSTEKTTIESSTLKRIRQVESRKAKVRRERSERSKKNCVLKGRPKGVKNKSTLLKEAVLQKAEDLVMDSWEEVVKTTLDLAKEGDTSCLKIL